MILFQIEVVKKDKKKVKVEIEAENEEDVIELCKKWYGENSIIKINKSKK